MLWNHSLEWSESRIQEKNCLTLNLCTLKVYICLTGNFTTRNTTTVTSFFMSELKYASTGLENPNFRESPVPIVPHSYRESSNADVVQFGHPCPGQKTVCQAISTGHIAYNMQSIPIAGMKLGDTAEIYSKVNRPPSTRPPVNNNVRPITGKLY